jgi:hypothetical protein
MRRGNAWHLFAPNLLSVRLPFVIVSDENFEYLVDLHLLRIVLFGSDAVLNLCSFCSLVVV